MRLENRLYPEWHDDVIRAQYTKVGAKGLSVMLERSKASIYDAAKRFGLRRDKAAASGEPIDPLDLTDEQEEAQDAAIRAAHDTGDIVQKALAAQPDVQRAMTEWK
jgi:hypothetical protein